MKKTFEVCGHCNFMIHVAAESYDDIESALWDTLTIYDMDDLIIDYAEDLSELDGLDEEE